LAIFYCAIPLGYALGFIIVGSWLNAESFGFTWQWRTVYIGEAILMAPFIIYCLLKGPLPFRFENNETPNMFKSICALMKNKLYMALVLGYAAQVFTTGSFAYFGVQYLQNRLNMDVDIAGISFGALTVFTGLVGTAGGGYLLDRLRTGLPDGPHAMAIAFKMMTILGVLAAPCCFLCFTLDGPAWFYVFLGLGELAFFACLSPANSAILWAVPFDLAPLACAMSVVFTHALGDAISPSIIGMILDGTNDNWSLTMFLNVCWSGWSIVCWGFGWRWSVQQAKEQDRQPLLGKLEESATAGSSDFLPGPPPVGSVLAVNG
jgi:hypothetical protein